MTIDQATDVVREALILALVLSLPILGASLVIGLVVSLLQAVTQIHEQTLSFVPKIVGMAIVAIVATPWVARLIMEFTERMLTQLG